MPEVLDDPVSESSLVPPGRIVRKMVTAPVGGAVTLLGKSDRETMPVLSRGLDRRPAFGGFNEADGVHCLSYYGLEDGIAAGTTFPARFRRVRST